MSPVRTAHVRHVRTAHVEAYCVDGSKHQHGLNAKPLVYGGYSQTLHEPQEVRASQCAVYVKHMHAASCTSMLLRK